MDLDDEGLVYWGKKLIVSGLGALGAAGLASIVRYTLQGEIDPMDIFHIAEGGFLSGLIVYQPKE